MARQNRSTISLQESTRPITRVALYARVSTFNNQDPEMQLSELREYTATTVGCIVLSQNCIRDRSEGSSISSRRSR